MKQSAERCSLLLSTLTAIFIIVSLIVFIFHIPPGRPSGRAQWEDPAAGSPAIVPVLLPFFTFSLPLLSIFDPLF